jgi:NADPH:quinone reductase-like Zn-dependent oxidoreductase
MKAVRFHDYGGPEVLSIEDVPIPVPGPGEVRVKIHAASMNPIDWKLRAGMLKERMPVNLPLTVGRDFAGVVDAVGAGVTEYKAGDEVFGQTEWGKDGTFAEYAVTIPAKIAPKPKSVDFVHAAGVPVAAGAAWHAVHGEDAGNVKAGQTVLVQGAAGGVGSYVVQFAKALGAKVIGTASAKNAAHLKSLGVDHVVDYTKEKFEDVVKGVDVVIDNVLGEVQKRSWKTLKPGGVLVSLSGPPSEELAKEHRARGAMASGRHGEAKLAEIGKMIDAGKIRPHVGEVLPLSEARKAHEMSQSGHARGKIVVKVVD